MNSVSRHGELRLRKRIGLPKRNVENQVKKVLKEGRPTTDFKGNFKSYLTQEELKYTSKLLVYKSNVYVFNNEDTLITVWQVPREYRSHLK